MVAADADRDDLKDGCKSTWRRPREKENFANRGNGELAGDSVASAQEAPVRAEIVARLPQSVGNIAITPDNQIIFSHHPFFNPDVRVAKLTSSTTFQPFPNADWNTPRKGTDHYLDNVLGLRSDENGIVWIIDMGFRTKITPKLVGWNTRADRLERIYYMPEPITRAGSQPQDIVIDQKNRKFYIADEDIGPGGDGSHAAIIIIDMDTGRARRVLDGDKSTVPENVPITVDGNDLTVPGKDGKPTIIKVGCDGITMDSGPNGFTSHRLAAVRSIASGLPI